MERMNKMHHIPKINFTQNTTSNPLNTTPKTCNRHQRYAQYTLQWWEVRRDNKISKVWTKCITKHILLLHEFTQHIISGKEAKKCHYKAKRGGLNSTFNPREERERGQERKMTNSFTNEPMITIYRIEKERHNCNPGFVFSTTCKL